MYSKTLGIARKYGAKAATAAGALVVSGMAAAQSTHGADIVAKVESSFTQGELIAGTVVLGFFAIWAIKLLWKAK